MYTIPEDVNCNVLTNQTLVQVCCNANQIAFHFGNGASIVLEGRATLSTGGDSITIEIEPPLANLDVLQLIEKTVAKVDVAKNRCDLTLTFDDDSVLTLIGSNE